MKVNFSKYITAVLLVIVTSSNGFTQDASSVKNLMIPEASITSTSVTLLWDKPLQYQDIATYQIFNNDKLVATSAKTNFTVQNLKPNQSYSFYIKAQTKAGKLSNKGSIVKAKTKIKSQVLNILDFGAKGDGKTLNTKAIQKTIDACIKGGTVYIPKGEFVSGALFLKSDMTLYIAEGGVLKGSSNIHDYEPFTMNRFEGWEMKTYASLINAGTLNRTDVYNVHNLSICGKGTIYGGGTPLGNAMIKANGIRSRGRLICIMNGQNINIQGLNIENSPCWTIHYIYCDKVTLHDLNIVSTARNGDGIDPDSSTDSYIFNCKFSTGDDCIAIKSGKNPEGNVVNRPTKNIRITDCDFTKGHSLAVGSEMSGGVSDVFIQDCKIGSLLYGLQIKATKDRGGYVKNVIVRDCDLLKVTLYTQLNYNNDGESAPILPQFSDMEFTNLNLSEAEANQTVIDVNGFQDEAHYTRNIVFKDVVLPKQSSIRLKNAEAITFNNVKCVDGTKPIYNIIESKNIVQ
nr:glycoside hydrolase family 28 protein [uncultured Pedobacter sp.]